VKTLFSVATIALDLSLVSTVFSYGLRAQRDELRSMRRQPRLLLLSLIALFVLTPALALVIVETVPMPLIAKVAIVALSLSIIPPLLPQKELKAGGNSTYAIGLTVTSAVLAVAIIPAQVAFLGDLTRRPYGLDPVEVLAVVVPLLAIPLAVGFILGRRWPDLAERIGAPLTRIAGIATLVALAVVLVAAFPSVREILDVGTVTAMVLFNIGAVAVGHLMGGPDRANSIVLGISSASRHPSIALTIATANYPGRNFAGAVVLCLLINSAVCSAYIRRWGPQTDPVNN
jgi:BASS family bile acid:Na+ symporter